MNLNKCIKNLDKKQKLSSFECKLLNNLKKNLSLKKGGGFLDNIKNLFFGKNDDPVAIKLLNNVNDIRERYNEIIRFDLSNISDIDILINFTNDILNEINSYELNTNFKIPDKFSKNILLNDLIFILSKLNELKNETKTFEQEQKIIIERSKKERKISELKNDINIGLISTDDKILVEKAINSGNELKKIFEEKLSFFPDSSIERQLHTLNRNLFKLRNKLNQINIELEKIRDLESGLPTEKEIDIETAETELELLRDDIRKQEQLKQKEINKRRLENRLPSINFDRDMQDDPSRMSSLVLNRNEIFVRNLLNRGISIENIINRLKNRGLSENKINKIVEKFL